MRLAGRSGQATIIKSVFLTTRHLGLFRIDCSDFTMDCLGDLSRAEARPFGIAVAAARTDESFYESMVVDISAGAVGTLGRRPGELRSLLAAI
jgi:hypothetical protein